jgi:hypothetical protein
MNCVKIHWQKKEAGDTIVIAPPIPELVEPIPFPESWPNRPWIFAEMVASQDGVVAWKRKDHTDDPVIQILGLDRNPKHADRVADKFFMRVLRTLGGVSFGRRTVGEQSELIGTPKEAGKDEEPELQAGYEALYRYREDRGLSRHPQNIIYSPSGRLEEQLSRHPIFNTPGLEAIVITTKAGETLLKDAGAEEKGVRVIAEGETDLDAAALVRSHERLFSDFGTRHLVCEGGETVLQSLHDAGILDEVFVTFTDVRIVEAAHEGIKRIFDFTREGGDLIAEGKTSPESGWVFRRYRFNKR